MMNDAVRNYNCDGGACTMPHGETRRLPLGGDGAVILCRQCYENEMRFRRGRIADGARRIDWATPEWKSLNVVSKGDPKREAWERRASREVDEGTFQGTLRTN